MTKQLIHIHQFRVSSTVIILAAHFGLTSCVVGKDVTGGERNHSYNVEQVRFYQKQPRNHLWCGLTWLDQIVFNDRSVLLWARRQAGRPKTHYGGNYAAAVHQRERGEREF